MPTNPTPSLSSAVNRDDLIAWFAKHVPNWPSETLAEELLADLSSAVNPSSQGEPVAFCCPCCGARGATDGKSSTVRGPAHPSPSREALEITDAMVNAAARELWNDRDARMGGTWDSRNADEVCVIQTKATARAMLIAALSPTDGRSSAGQSDNTWRGSALTKALETEEKYLHDMIDAENTGGIMHGDVEGAFHRLKEALDIRCPVVNDNWIKLSDREPKFNQKVMAWCTYPAGAETRECIWKGNHFLGYGLEQNVEYWQPYPSKPAALRSPAVCESSEGGK